MNWYVAHEPVVVALVVVGLGVVTQLVPSLFLFFVSVPGQHPNFQALHAGVVLAAVVVAALGGVFAALKKGNSNVKNSMSIIFCKVPSYGLSKIKMI